MKKSLITIKNLRVKRGQKVVLRVEKLDIQRDEVLAVVGPNGAGKSTLLLTLARLLKPEQGEISFNGAQAQIESDTMYRRRIALVMQDPLLFDTSVFENVASGLRFRGVDRDEILVKVPLWLGRLGVSHLSKRRASQLSGGEAQRVSLARALVLEPELLLLDEPFSALDPPTRSSILDDLGLLLKETSTTTLFVTHNLPEAVQLADRMAVVIDNRLQQIGAANSLFERPATDEVARFLNLRLMPQSV
ncbi:MAG: ABC transporter ATP-binding protein [Anaerolineae bacterium]|jgi:tungstate transport system ATP-binding protein|nr:ABC transporter ATP-binding protein [Anaerolineae bacterium]MBT7191672.1 ABC transporter ATP-binding protein [Anaerolineae bacterium]MBT7991772.1 ABC transporter ATP-binding protein [Anaerolineae bacterium]